MGRKLDTFLTAVAVVTASFLALQALTELIAYIRVPPPPVPPAIEERDGVFYVTYKWNFKGKQYVYKDAIPKSFYLYYRNKVRIQPYEYEKFVEDKHDDEWMARLANQIWSLEPGLPERERLDLLLSFVQSFPYLKDQESVGREEYPRYPVETIVDGGGDCEDTSILFASLARALGYKVVLLVFVKEEHFALGIKVPWAGEVAHYVVGGETYAFCETTSTGWRVGEKPPRLVSNPWIIIVR